MKRAALVFVLLLLNTVALFAAPPEAEAEGVLADEVFDSTASLSLILNAQ